MTVLRVKNKAFSESADETIKDDVNAQTQRKTLYVITDGSRLDTPNTILRATGVPRLRDVFTLTPETDSSLRCKRREVERKSDTVWEVVCTYDDETAPPEKAPKPKDPSGGDNPLDEEATLAWSSKDIEVFDNKDVEGTIQKNSAGTLFKKPLPKHVPCMVLTINRNENAFDPLRMVKFYKRCNANQWFRVNRRAALIDEISGQWSVKKGVGFWAVKYTVLILGGDHDRKTGSENLWRPTMVLDEGPFVLARDDQGANDVARDTSVTLARDAKGVAHGKDIKLDGHGHPLGPNKDPVYLPFHMYYEADFNQLNLP